MIAQTRIGTLNEILATREKMKFSHRINLSSDKNYKEMSTWCHENCKGIWRGNNWSATYFQFDDSDDALMFSLKWGSS